MVSDKISISDDNNNKYHGDSDDNINSGNSNCSIHNISDDNDYGFI